MLHSDGNHTLAVVGPDLRAGQSAATHSIPRVLLVSAPGSSARAQNGPLGNIEQLAAKYPDVAYIRTLPVPLANQN
jgi:hypothetical protein